MRVVVLVVLVVVMMVVVRVRGVRGVREVLVAGHGCRLGSVATEECDDLCVCVLVSLWTEVGGGLATECMSAQACREMCVCVCQGGGRGKREKGQQTSAREGGSW